MVSLYFDGTSRTYLLALIRVLVEYSRLVELGLE